MKDHVLVEGINWSVSGVNATDKTEDAFAARHMKDDGTYKDFSPEKKTASLKLAWKLVQENTPKAEVAAKK